MLIKKKQLLLSFTPTILHANLLKSVDVLSNVGIATVTCLPTQKIA